MCLCFLSNQTTPRWTTYRVSSKRKARRRRSVSLGCKDSVVFLFSWRNQIKHFIAFGTVFGLPLLAITPGSYSVTDSLKWMRIIYANDLYDLPAYNLLTVWNGVQLVYFTQAQFNGFLSAPWMSKLFLLCCRNVNQKEVVFIWLRSRPSSIQFSDWNIYPYCCAFLCICHIFPLEGSVG